MRSGIGRATVLCFARDGCDQLILGDLSVEGLQETQKLVLEKYPSTQIEIQRLDVGDENSVEAIYKVAVSKFGRVDFVANVAGYGHPAQPITSLTVDHYQTSFNVNIRGVGTIENISKPES